MTRQHVLTEEAFTEAMETSFHEGKLKAANEAGRKAFVEHKYCLPTVLNNGPFTLTAIVSVLEYYKSLSYTGEMVLFITHDNMQTMLTESEFANVFDPVSQYEVIQNGRIGMLLGLNVYTDAYLTPDFHYINTPCIRFKLNEKEKNNVNN